MRACERLVARVWRCGCLCAAVGPRRRPCSACAARTGGGRLQKAVSPPYVAVRPTVRPRTGYAAVATHVYGWDLRAPGMIVREPARLQQSRKRRDRAYCAARDERRARRGGRRRRCAHRRRRQHGRRAGCDLRRDCRTARRPQQHLQLGRLPAGRADMRMLHRRPRRALRALGLAHCRQARRVGARRAERPIRGGARG